MVVVVVCGEREREEHLHLLINLTQQLLLAAESWVRSRVAL